eukprot:CAMPEP_0119398206 /NCGR_PEP_ID=MMETSP1334-20130426/140727_1 /TAXON_ID=127549 /ORGANISM="Calcidiscus leptoporus, Strain RCC1130" /LENGTH=170 /DNA_ID=CAMNT_0007422063 /DNA_START=32 /DNA_END=546 /DNA_ORIENTATION=+
MPCANVAKVHIKCSQHRMNVKGEARVQDGGGALLVKKRANKCARQNLWRGNTNAHQHTCVGENALTLVLERASSAPGASTHQTTREEEQDAREPIALKREQIHRQARVCEEEQVQRPRDVVHRRRERIARVREIDDDEAGDHAHDQGVLPLPAPLRVFATRRGFCHCQRP